MLAVIETHPVQYHAPVFRRVQAEFGVPVTAIYGSDFSVTGYRDQEFGATFQWDTDLLSGYEARFLSRVANGGAANYETVSAKGLRAVLRESKPRAVLLLGYASHFDRAAFYEAWRGGYPILWRGEAHDGARTRSRVKALAREAALRLLYSRVARFLYLGQRAREHYERLGCPAEKLVFAPYCVDTTPFRCDETARQDLRGPTRQELGITENETVILFSGKLSQRKGPDLLVKAARQLAAQQRERKFHLLFLGAGAMQEELQHLADTPALRTTFTGFQNQTRLSRFYHAADLFVLPSRYAETWGLVVNEALHHGLPCVVSETVGSAPDLVAQGVTGHTFKSDELAALVTALQNALALTGSAQVRAQCRAQVQNYTVSQAARGIAEAYRAVLAK